MGGATSRPPSPASAHGEVRISGTIGTHTDPATTATPDGSSPPAGPELVWHRANGPRELERFLASPIRWVECDLRLGDDERLVVSHEPVEAGARPMAFDDWLDAVIGAGRSTKLDLKEGGPVVDGALPALQRRSVEDDRVWWNAAVEIPGGEQGWRRLRAERPRTRLSCPLDNLSAWLSFGEPAAFELVRRLRDWGIDRVCLGIESAGVAMLVPALQRLRWPVNIWDVDDRARALRPDSITADLGNL
jgi:hypothetical protein